MNIVSIIGIGILCCLGFVLLKQTKPEFSFLIIIVGGIIISLSVFDKIGLVINTFTDITEKTGLNKDIFAVVLKIIGMGYLTEFGAGICNDAGCPSIADKINLAGKILILVISLPIINGLVNIMIEMLL